VTKARIIALGTLLVTALALPARGAVPGRIPNLSSRPRALHASAAAVLGSVVAG